MKKITWMLSLFLILALAAVPSLAATTSVSVDGKDYVFYGDQSVYQADGKTFIIESQSNNTMVVSAVDVSTIALETDSATTIMATSDSSYAYASSSTEITEDGSDRGISYDQYAQFGLSYDATTDALYYQGQRVRVFVDSYPIGDGAYASVEHCDLTGVIDVEAQRDLTKNQYNGDGSYTPGGTLTGLRKLSDDEFASRNLSPWTSPERNITFAYSGESMTPQEKAAYYAPYAEVGITYNTSTDQLIYQGKAVRVFLDVRQTNGADFSSGLFKGTMTQFTNESGEIDISIIRDYALPDAQGDGKLIGVRIENE